MQRTCILLRSKFINSSYDIFFYIITVYNYLKGETFSLSGIDYE